MKATILSFMVIALLNICTSGNRLQELAEDIDDFRTIKNVLNKPKTLDREKTEADLLFERVLRRSLVTSSSNSNEGYSPILGFSYSNCGSTSDPIKINKLVVSPDPIQLPGTIQVSAIAETNETLGATPIKADLVLKKKVLIWIPIPCIDNVGSCTYDNLCDMDPYKNKTCPSIFTQNHIPCKCPISKGSYNLPLASINVTASLPGGDYEAKVTLTSEEKRMMDFHVQNPMENFVAKDNLQKFNTTIPEYPGNPSAAIASSVSPIINPPVMTPGMNPDFPNLMDQYCLNYMTSIGNQTQTREPMSLLGSSVGNGVKYHEILQSSIAGMPSPLAGEGWMLLPPNRNAPPPRLRERPIGCKTIFVGGLPKVLADNQERAENILKASFSRFADVREIRVNQRQFAHVRFFTEEPTVAAVSLSGFRLVVDGLDDKMHSSRLHVDYACNREDSREWDNHIRSLERERRLQERMNPPSPTPITPFSDAEVSVLTEKIKDSETFEKAGRVLYTWLDRGELSRRNANHFYSLIQCANSHIRSLVSEKKSCQEALESAKFLHDQKMSVIIRQLGQIQNILQAAFKQKCWDHFSKPQRKNLESWRKHCEDLVAREQFQHLESRQEDEMDLSDSDIEASDPLPSQAVSQASPTQESIVFSSMKINTKVASDVRITAEKELHAENIRLREQVVTLQRQLIRLITTHSEQEQSNPKRRRVSVPTEDSDKGKEAPNSSENQTQGGEHQSDVALLKEVLHGTQESLLNMQRQLEAETKKRSEVESQLEALKRSSYENENIFQSTHASSHDEGKIKTSELAIISLISTYLLIHPSGAEVDGINNYLHRFGHHLSSEEIDSLLERASSLIERKNKHGRSLYFRRDFLETDDRAHSDKSSPA